MSSALTRDPLFSVVEIEINTRCNRRCTYCPNSIAPRSGPAFMTDAQFDLILDRLVEVGFAGRLSYHFYGEPLLHPHLVGFVERSRAALPGARLVLYTNGDRLTDERHRQLEAAGIDRFIVTYHDGVVGPQRPRTDRLIPTNLVITNRGGLLSRAGDGAISAPCYAPATMLIITINGDVVLCYEDARAQLVLGNVCRQPIADIWWSERFVGYRAALRNGDRSLEICRKCNNVAHTTDMGAFDHVA